MAHEGIGIILGMMLFTATILIGAYFNDSLFINILASISIMMTVFTLYFFRDPDRVIPDIDNGVISPADGKVIEIVEEQENEYLRAQATRVSIFLNVFDVHVNRIPISGEVGFFRYQKGEFVKAYKCEASDVNEQTVIGIESGDRRVLFKQIAGLIARRIVCNIRAGNLVTLGERFGMIKFGSRVDIFMPKEVEIQVKLNEKVRGGESIIGVFK